NMQNAHKQFYANQTRLRSATKIANTGKCILCS
ncbi:MAG: hypothetical protein ACI9DS_000812, partial [Glaciecola sp.]